MYPVQTIIVAVLLGITYVVISRLNSEYAGNAAKTTNRENALRTAQIYLAPYNNIWRNLTLSNKYCTLRLGYDGKTITCIDKNNYDRRFSINSSSVYTNSDLWNLLCTRFSYNTTFERVIELCKVFNANIDMQEPPAQQPAHTDINTVATDMNRTSPPKEKLDINNASEVEITALPGVSIVLAKKLIKRRDEIKGFKSTEEVLNFLNLKPHMENQLRELICVKKIKGTKQSERYKERNVDI